MTDKTDKGGTVSGHVRNVSATERLRALLTERGVEWRKAPHYSSESQDNETIFVGNGIEWYANDHMNGRLGLRALRYEVTPEQAIDATLGRGTCHIDLVGYDEREDRFQCRSCDWSISVRRGTWPRFNYCPNCGRKVVE